MNGELARRDARVRRTRRQGARLARTAPISVSRSDAQTRRRQVDDRSAVRGRGAHSVQAEPPVSHYETMCRNKFREHIAFVRPITGAMLPERESLSS